MNALSVLHDLPDTDEEIKIWVAKAINEILSGEYDKTETKKKLYFATLAFNKVRNLLPK